MSIRRNLDHISARLPLWHLHWYVTVDSTQLEAQRLIDEACPDHTAVVSQEQTAGMGRLGRRWHSESGQGLYLSCVLRVELPPAHLPGLTLALGLAAKRTIEEIAELDCDLRWPNDVLVAGRKVCGILTQVHAGAVVAGIGINLNQRDFPMEIEAIATSLDREGASNFSREDLLVRLLDYVEEYTQLYCRDGRDIVYRAFRMNSTYAQGKRVIVEQEGQTLRGVTDGLDADGFLLLRTDDGQRVTILAGGVRPAV